MTLKAKKIDGGVYLVLDPRMDMDILLEKLGQALDGGVSVLQIWNIWPGSFGIEDKHDFISGIKKKSAGYSIPVLINEEWELLHKTDLDGVHFDGIPDQYHQLKSLINREFISGITCGNDLDVVRWAEDNNLDYISFCSMFPSSSVGSCEIVRPETVRNAREITSIPIFVSGGITAGNLPDLADLDIDGVAVISGILSSGSPRQSASDYVEALHKLRTKKDDV